MSLFRGQLSGQAAACLYLRICGSKIEVQGCIENLVCGKGDGLRFSR